MATPYRPKPPREVRGRVRSPKRSAPTPVRRVDAGQPSTVHERIVVEATDVEKLLTLEQAAEASGMSLHMLKGHVARGTVPVVRIGRSVRVRLSDLRRSAEPSPRAKE